MNTVTPQVGMRTTLRGIDCKIIAVHPAGTIDVQEVNGERCWRVTGLPFGAQWGARSKVICELIDKWQREHLDIDTTKRRAEVFNTAKEAANRL